MEDRQRHGCVTAWLIFMIVGNSLVSLVYVFAGKYLAQPQSILLAFPIISLLNVVFAVMLLQRKKWAFWGFIASSVVTFSYNISNGNNILFSVLGLSAGFVLFAILQIRQNGVSSWDGLD